MTRLDAALLVAALLAGAALALALERRLRRLRGSLRARRRSARALRGERDAERLLAGLGYRLTARQAHTVWLVEAGGETHEVELRADLLVERGGRRFVAEVKTGEAAPSLANASTRRQLLEYRVAYDVDGVLLVDVEGDAVLEVVFPLIGPAADPGRAWAPILAALAAGAAAGAAAGGLFG